LFCLILSAATVATLFYLGFKVSQKQNEQASFSKSPIINLASLSLPFVPNQGQWNKKVKFKADLFSGALLVGENELVYSLVVADKTSDKAKPAEQSEIFAAKPELNRSLVFKEKFVSPDGQELDFCPRGEEKTGARVSYFRGKEASSYLSQVPSYKSLSLGRVFPGIEVRLRASSGNVEKLFYLNPGARAEDIVLKVEGIASIKVAEDGYLLLQSEAGDLAMMKPRAFQEKNGQKRPVEVAYELRDQDKYGFKVIGTYDPEATLIIDPALSTLSASTFVGGTGNDRGFCLAVDGDGYVYVAGYTLSASSDYPTTSGAYDTTANGGYDLFVSKLNNSLTELVASTYLGGKGTDYVYSMALAQDGNIFLTGITNSTDFPTTPGAYQRNYQGGEYDSFIVKLSSDLSSLLASTYLGGRGLDYSSALSLIPFSYENDRVVITGMTDSPDFPVSPGAFSTSLKGGQDVFVAILSNSLGTIEASTLIGGSDYDIGSAIAVDGLGHFWVAGRTKSPDFPVTPNAYDSTYNGDYDGFVLHLAPDLNELYSSTYIGGHGSDYLYSLALGSQNKVFVAGYTNSSDYPVTEGAYDTSYNGSYDVFISKLSPSLETLTASTFLGSSDDDRCRAMVVDGLGSIYLTGWTKSAYFPTTSGAYSRTHNGSFEVFISKISGNLGVLFASTLVGGGNDDLGYSLAVDSSGKVYVTGYTQSSAFPVTENTYDSSLSGTDVFVLEFSSTDRYLLTVSRSGDGEGVVISSDGGINCGSDCSELYDSGQQVTLSATPDQNSVFAGWSGEVIGVDNPVTITMDSEKTAIAKFVPAGATFTLTVIKSGPGQGTVKSEDGQIDCGEICTTTYPAGTVVKLTATPDENSGFDSWTGDISSTTNTITFIMDEDKTAIAVFGPTPLPDLSGEWQSLKVSGFMGRTKVIAGTLLVKNLGEAVASSGYKISFYLSNNGSSLDTLLNNRVISFDLKAESSRTISYVYYLRSTVLVSGKYLVAYLDSDNILEEKNENNNLVVFGRIGETSAVAGEDELQRSLKKGSPKPVIR